MADEYVSKEEYLSLNNKVLVMSEQCIACRTSLNSDVKHLGEELKDTKRDLYDIKMMVQKITEQVSGLTVKVSLVVAGIVGAINFIIPIFIHK